MNKQSISFKLSMLILLISLTPLLILASYSYLEKTKAQTTHIKDTLTRVVDSGVDSIDDELIEAKTAVESIATLPEFSTLVTIAAKTPNDDASSAIQDIREDILAATHANPSLQEAYIRSTDGSIIFSSSTTAPQRTLLADTSFPLARKGITSVSEVIPNYDPLLNEKREYETGVPILFVSAPLLLNETIIGVLTFRIDSQSIFPKPQRYLEETESGEQYVVNSEGKLISQSRFTNRARDLGLLNRRPEFELRVIDPTTGTINPLFLSAKQNETTVSIKGYRDYRGIQVVGAARKIPETAWTYIAEIDKEEAYSDINRLQLFLFFELVTSILLIIAVSSYAGLYVTRPFIVLSRAADALKRGKFSFRTRIQTHDEFEELSHAFNNAAKELGKTDTQRKQIDSAKTRFLSITSHELRSPMTPMRAQLQMLSKGYFGKLTSKQNNSVQTVLRNANRLDTILKDFLDISRIEAGRIKFTIKKTDLRKLIIETAKLNEHYLPEKKLRITTSVPALPPVQTDPDRITQVLSNMLTNASKFSPQNGTITITAQPLAKHILISVKDQGIGIAPKDQQKLFEPFAQVEQTLSRQHQGTGLGLAISKGLLSALGGRIWIESKAGKGTTFYFTVPLKAQSQEAPAQSIFGASNDAQRTIERAFYDALGARGIADYARLQKEGLANKEDLLRYVRESRKNGKMTPAQAKELSKKINEQAD